MHIQILNTKETNFLAYMDYTLSSSSFSTSRSMNDNREDIWDWLHSLPPLHQWKQNSMSISLCSSPSSSLYLSFSVSKTSSSSPSSSSYLIMSIFANLSTLSISLWSSKPFKANPSSQTLISPQSIQTLILNTIQDILNYGCFSIQQLPSTIISTLSQSSIYFLKESFNLSLLTLTFLICIYEAPLDLRPHCLVKLKDRLLTPRSQNASKNLLRTLGAFLEECWMRTLNLAITNWKAVTINNSQVIRCPSPMFSNSVSGFGMWKLQFYCPVVAMEVESSNGGVADEKLMFSLKYHQLEGVVQLNHKVVVTDKWVDVMVNIDNIRLSIVPLVSEALLSNRGAGASEKHFPSRISLQLTPCPPSTDIISVSVSKSSDNPSREIGHEMGFEGSFEPPSSLIPALRLSATETTTTTLKPWKFEESAQGNSGSISWFLHDVGDGREVFSSRLSKMAVFQPKAWFRNRYKSANRPFTRQGGVVFAKNEYGDQSVCWKVDKGSIGKRMEWELKGCVGLTYWPNNHWSFYNETRRAEFKETLHLTLS